MATITLKGNAINTIGELPAVGSKAKSFELVMTDLSTTKLSDFKSGSFGKEYGLEITNGPLAGLHSRCIVVLNDEGTIVHTEQVTETVDEPNYEAALNSLK